LSIKPQNRTIKEQYAEINDMYNKMSGLEIRIESQEQYSRRTSLRFHNIQVPVDERGRIVHPVDTDQLILQVCNTKLGLDININDIGRSHVIGKVKKCLNCQVPIISNKKQSLHQQRKLSKVTQMVFL
jgi:hypothetical protein